MYLYIACVYTYAYTRAHAYTIVHIYAHLYTHLCGLHMVGYLGLCACKKSCQRGNPAFWDSYSCMGRVPKAVTKGTGSRTFPSCEHAWVSGFRVSRILRHCFGQRFYPSLHPRRDLDQLCQNAELETRRGPQFEGPAHALIIAALARVVSCVLHVHDSISGMRLQT